MIRGFVILAAMVRGSSDQQSFVRFEFSRHILATAASLRAYVVGTASEFRAAA